MNKVQSLARSLQKEISKNGYDNSVAVFLLSKDDVMRAYGVSEMTALKVVVQVQELFCSMSPKVYESIIDTFIPQVYQSDPIAQLSDLALQKHIILAQIDISG